MTNYTIIAAIAAVSAIAISQPALAEQQTDTIAVSASVSQNCIIDASVLAFPSVNTLSGQAVDGAGTIDVTCTSETPWTASADAGLGSDATVAERKLVSGSNQLNYALFTDSGRSNVWGSGEGATLGDVGSGSVQQKAFYGRIAENQTSAPAGDYADTVTVTVSY